MKADPLTMPREFSIGLYPREDAEDAEWAIYSRTSRTWSDFQGNSSDSAHDRVEAICARRNRDLMGVA